MKKKLLVFLVAVFAFVPFVNAEELASNSTYVDTISFDSAEIDTYEPTTDGISFDMIRTVRRNEDNGIGYDCHVTYTITSQYDIEANNGAFVLNVFNDVLNYDELGNGKNTMPGFEYSIYLTIVNETKYTFEFQKDSLIISSVSYKEKNEEGKETITGFDGNEIQLDSKYNIIRTKNSILDKLLRKGKNSSDYSDENISDLLKKEKDKDGNQLYPNGIDDLDKYYLNYINQTFKKDYKSLFEVDLTYITIILQGNGPTDYRETNKVVAKIGYDLSYNKLLTITPETYPDFTTNPEGCFSIGEYMRENAPKELEEQIKDYVENIDEKENTKFTLTLNGPKTGNAYQSHSFGINVSVKLYAENHNVYVNYINVDGKVIADQDYYSGIYTGKDYKTAAKTIEGYELVRVDGEATGVMADQDVVVTYVYEYVLGQGGDDVDLEPIVVQTGSEVDYSLMTSAFITASLIVLALRTKKKNN